MRESTGRMPSQSLLPIKSQRYYYHNRFLKPGALARLRDFKLKTRSQIFNSHAQISLSELLLPHSASTFTSSSSDQTNPVPSPMDFGVPCFALRINGPRCLLRKKLFAAAPVFSESINIFWLSNVQEKHIVCSSASSSLLNLQLGVVCFDRMMLKKT